MSSPNLRKRKDVVSETLSVHSTEPKVGGLVSKSDVKRQRLDASQTILSHPINRAITNITFNQPKNW